jgi:hypothetical protein
MSEDLHPPRVADQGCLVLSNINFEKKTSGSYRRNLDETERGGSDKSQMQDFNNPLQ